MPGFPGLAARVVHRLGPVKKEVKTGFVLRNSGLMDRQLFDPLGHQGMARPPAEIFPAQQPGGRRCSSRAGDVVAVAQTGWGGELIEQPAETGEGLGWV